MGVFANEPPAGHPDWIGAHTRNQPWHGQSGFEAMGREVPPFRKAEAERHLKLMGFPDAEQRFEIVNAMSEAIRRDNTHEALEVGYRKKLDVTGCYRLLAVLLNHTELGERE